MNPRLFTTTTLRSGVSQTKAHQVRHRSVLGVTLDNGAILCQDRHGKRDCERPERLGIGAMAIRDTSSI